MTNINTSPRMINGRVEMFSKVSSMIIRWEKEEESLLEMVEPGGRRPRRRSKGFHELCSKFEPTEDDQGIQLEIDVRGRERGGEETKILSGSEFEKKRKTEHIILFFGIDGKLVENENKANQGSPKTS